MRDMKAVKANGISWFLDDEDLVPAIQKLNEQRDTRRTYRVLRYRNNAIFAKYFLEEGIWGLVRNRIDPRGKREYQIGKGLISFSIPTPNPVGYGLGRTGSFALQEWIDARSFRTVFAERTLRPELLKGLADLLRKLRMAGIRHNDLHLDNIIVRGESLYIIDLHKARVRKIPFFFFDDTLNVVHALGPVYRDLSEAEKSDFFRLYGRPEIRPAVEKRFVEEEVGWIERKKARAFSATSKLTRIGRRVYVRDVENTAEGVFVERIKNDRKVRVERHSDHIRKIYRNNRRLKKAWRNHVAIEYLEMPIVPKPFYVQRGTLFASGFIAMEDLRGRGEELDRYLDRRYNAMDAHLARRFIDSLSQFLSMLLRKGILHKDLKACNVFVLEDGFRLLDVEDVIFCPYTEEDIRLLLFQINTTVPGRVSFSHRARFFFKISRELGLERSEKKRVFVEVMRASVREAIVYEGVNGLRKESWTDHPA
jgi:tRNA A-37 threonylcarbamoyl transferase component Bud32